MACASFLVALCTILTGSAYGNTLSTVEVVETALAMDTTPRLESSMNFATSITEEETTEEETTIAKAEETTEATTVPSTKKEEATKETSKPAKTISVVNDTESKKDVDSIKTLSGFKNTGLPISELEPPEDLKLDENGIPVNYKRAVQAKATAYNGDSATASGRKPMPGHIAVNPKEYPYGTELYIVSADGSYVYGYCVAADTGGFVKMGNTDVDVYMDTVDMCYDWGNRDIIIYVL